MLWIHIFAVFIYAVRKIIGAIWNQKIKYTFITNEGTNFRDDEAILLASIIESN